MKNGEESFDQSGIFPRQAHVKIPKGLYEEEHGRKGFFGRVSHLYHQNPLTSWTEIEGEARPRALRPTFDTIKEKKLFEPGVDIPLLDNRDCVISLSTLNQTPENFFRNADFDELFFIHKGLGRVETIYGHLDFVEGDYIVMPRGTTYKFFPSSSCSILKIESTSEFEQPNRGLLGRNALYDQSVITKPKAQVGSECDKDSYTIEIKRAGKITRVTYPFNPLDAVGWKGSVYPWKISIYDYCPITSHRYHIPPSGHTTFVTQNFVVCSFVARPLEHTSEEVLKVPFYHSNIDYDEVIFYHKGDFFSRDGIDSGALTFHPQGIHHGPHPKAFAAANEKTFTDEYAVMIDSRHPLSPTEAFQALENGDYWKSWQ